MLFENGLKLSVKSIKPGHPPQSAQHDEGRNFLPMNFFNTA